MTHPGKGVARLPTRTKKKHLEGMNRVVELNDRYIKYRNAGNYPALLELADVYESMGMKARANEIRRECE